MTDILNKSTVLVLNRHWTVMSKLSEPLPVFVTTLLKGTVVPCSATGTAAPEIVTPALGVTLKLAVFV